MVLKKGWIESIDHFLFWINRLTIESNRRLTCGLTSAPPHPAHWLPFVALANHGYSPRPTSEPPMILVSVPENTSSALVDRVMRAKSKRVAAFLSATIVVLCCLEIWKPKANLCNRSYQNIKFENVWLWVSSAQKRQKEGGVLFPLLMTKIVRSCHHVQIYRTPSGLLQMK